jgi:hypothetical protein
MDLMTTMMDGMLYKVNKFFKGENNCVFAINTNHYGTVFHHVGSVEQSGTVEVDCVLFRDMD